MLVGTLHGCSKSGSLLLQDSTGQFPVLLTSTSHVSLKHVTLPASSDVIRCRGEEPFRLSHVQFGTNIIVTDFLIIFEKTVNLSSTDAPASEITAYLHIISFDIVSASSPSPSLASRSKSFHEPPSFLIREDKSEDKILFFRILNKNGSVVSSACRLEFTCQALVHPNLDMLLLHLLEEGRKKMLVKEVLKIAVYFGGDAYKWFSLISNGCTYSLSLSNSSDGVLPSWDVLKKNLVLCVREDMEIKLVREDLKFTCACDVADISHQLLLPLFPTLVCIESTAETRYS